MDLRILPGRGQFPVAVEVAVPVQPAAEAGLPVGLGEIGDVGFARAIPAAAVGAQIAQKALAVLDEQRRRIGDAAPQHHSHGLGDVALEFGFGDAGRLKILPVEIGDAALAQALAAAGRDHERAAERSGPRPW